MNLLQNAHLMLRSFLMITSVFLASSLQIKGQQGVFDRSLQLHIKDSSGGTIAVIQSNGNTLLGTVQVCEGENISIEIADSFPLICQGCPDALFYNESSYCDGECITVTPPDVLIDYQGGSSDFTTDITYPTPPSFDCYASSKVIVALTPSSTDTFSISWQTIRQMIYEDGRLCNPDNFPFNQVVNYSNKVLLEVIPNIDATISAPFSVTAGELIPITFFDCSSDLNYELQEICSNWESENLSQSCGATNNPIVIGYLAPAYTTSLTFRVLYGYSTQACGSVLRYTNEITVNVIESPVENACENNPNITSTEAMLQDETLVANRTDRDYHYYDTTTVICNISENCSVESVWNKVKSDISFQIPVLNDFDPIIPSLWESTPSNGAYEDCDDALIASTYQRVILNMGLIGAVFQIFFDINDQDPVKIVIDESCKCITNYTLPTHILHPGKVRRCVKKNECNEIVLETVGNGFTTAGPSMLGNYLARSNEEIGYEVFGNVSEKLKNACQQ